MSDSKTVVALEIGTGKMQVFVGEIVDNKMLRIVGMGQAPSEGIKKGDIFDLRKAASSAQTAIVGAERTISTGINSVCLGISGTHIKGFRTVGSANVSSADGLVTRKDIDRARDDAKSKSLVEGKSYIHQICCGYYLDGRFSSNPLGERANKIDAEFWMVYGDNEKIEQALAIVQSLGLEVEYLVFSGIASARIVTSAEEKNAGVLCIDIGCGTADYAFYKHGRPIQAGVIPVGGDHITNDLSFGLRLSRKNSERIKTRFAKALITEQEAESTIWTEGDKQIGDRKIPVEAINCVVRARLEELFLLLRSELGEYFNSGAIKCVVFTGGTSRMARLCELAQRVFEVPCSTAKFSKSVKDSLRHPEYSGALGLLDHALSETIKESGNKRRSMSKILKKVFGLR